VTTLTTRFLTKLRASCGAYPSTGGKLMAVPFRAVLRSGVVVFAGLGAGAAFVVLGLAGVALRAQCPDGATDLGACIAEAVDPVVTGSTEPEFQASTMIAMKRPEVAFDPAPVSAHEVDLAAVGGMIEATFDLLIDPAATETSVAAADTTAETAPSTVVAKRVVRSVKVNANGDPVWPVSAYAGDTDRVEVASTAKAAIEAEVGSIATAAAIEPLVANAAEPGPDGTAVPDRHLASVTGGPTNVRSGPSTDHKRLFVLGEGTEVEALAVTANWVRIVDLEGRAGWIYADYLAGVDVAALPAPPDDEVAPPNKVEVAAVTPEPRSRRPATTPEPQQVAVAAEAEPEAAPKKKQVASGDVRTVKGTGVNVRSGPSTSSGKLFALAAGVPVTVLENQRGWLKVTDPEGRTGWAYSSFIN
jgi:SH3-like domain-containing protein